MSFIQDVFNDIIPLVEARTGKKILPDKQDSPLDILDYLDKIKKEVEPGLYLGKDCHIGKQVVTKGVIIGGDNVKLEDYAYLRGPVILGSTTFVSAEVKNSIILQGTFAVHRSSYIGDSVIGRDCNVGAGAQFANFRFDEAEILLRKDGEKIPTNRNKIGAFVEHKCKFGINAVIPPGSYITEGTWWVGSKPLVKKHKVDLKTQ